MSQDEKQILEVSIENEKRDNSSEFAKEKRKLKNRNILKLMNLNESQQKNDLKDSVIKVIENELNCKIICDIGYGVSTTTKVVFNNQTRDYNALKVVSFKRDYFINIGIYLIYYIFLHFLLILLFFLLNFFIKIF